MNDDADLEWIGRQVLGRYRVMRRLAHGGMGVVYLGRLEGAAGFSKPVVIKRIISDSDDQQANNARFIREAQILSNLQHPGIVGVLDFGEEDERYSMVLEYVNGYDLGRWLKYLQVKAQTMPWEEAVFITLRLLEALSYAHGFRRSDGSAAEILHRDISPGNVLLDLDGRVRLADFGIARMDASEQFKTQTGVLKGKVAYLAPELFSGSPPSRASDIYACAVILYQMLAGANPFAAHNDSRVMWRVIMEGPSPLARQRDDLPPGLEELIFAAIDRDLLRRHEDAESFAAELRRVLPRSEAEIQDALREHVRGDFNGDMPALLRLETLSERDRAWRQGLPSAEGTRNIPAQEPSSLAHSETPATVSEEPGPAPPYQPQLTVRAERRAPPAPADGVTLPQVTTQRAGPRLSLAALVGLGLAMSVVIGLIVAAALLRLQQPSQPAGASRFIVVESPEQKRASESGAAATPSPAPTAEPAALPSAVNAERDAPRAPKTVRKTRPPAPDSSAALSQAFARRQGSLTRCFEQHAREVDGRPEISVTFEVAPAGEVSSAGLAPPALEATPLGRCLLDVARSTRFGALGKVTRFSIPIRASAVQR